MISLESCNVPVFTLFTKRYASLSSAWTGKLPTWDFEWDELRKASDRDCQSIVKLTLDGQCLGLIRFGLYYYPDVPTFVEIEQLESHPCSRGVLDERLAKPVGFWLIWYAIKTGLKYCEPIEEEPFVILSAYEEALDYYENKVKMELVGPVRISPDEDGYLFRFSLSQAKAFCEWIESKYGTPVE